MKRLEALSATQENWRRLRVAKKGTLPIHPETVLFRLSGGILCQALGNPVGDTSNFHSLVFSMLPSRVPREVLSWKFDDIDQPVSDFLVDASLDLLILLGDNFAFVLLLLLLPPHPLTGSTTSDSLLSGHKSTSTFDPFQPANIIHMPPKMSYPLTFP